MKRNTFLVLTLLGVVLSVPVAEIEEDKYAAVKYYGDTCVHLEGCGASKSERTGHGPSVDSKYKEDRVLQTLVLDSENMELDSLTLAASDEGDSQEENLIPALPPSNRARNWGLGFGLIALFTFCSLIYVYRHQIPQNSTFSHFISICSAYVSQLTSKLPHLNFVMPTISSSTFSFSKSSYSKTKANTDRSQFRPDSTALLQWSEEEDPSFPETSTRGSKSNQSTWRSKLPSLSKSRKSGKRAGGGVYGGELNEESLESGYEEVGLLPSPRQGTYTASSSGKSYGTV